MSRMRREIVQCMSGLTRKDSELSARFRFPASFIGFQGHFPEKKILPGVCQLQCAMSMVEELMQRQVVLREAVMVKFFHPIEPDQEIDCACTGLQEGTDSEFTLKAVMHREGQKVSEMKLRVSYEE